jgi:hypothetical protein
VEKVVRCYGGDPARLLDCCRCVYFLQHIAQEEDRFQKCKRENGEGRAEKW